MRQFEQVFPPDCDVIGYGNRFCDPQIGGAYLEQAIALGNWPIAREGHLAMMRQALSQGRTGVAMQHFSQAAKLIDATGTPDPRRRTFHTAAMEIFEKGAAGGSADIQLMLRLVRLAVNHPDVVDVGRPGYSARLERVATLLEKGERGLGSDAEAAECEDFFVEQVHTFLPGFSAPRGDFRRFFAARQEERLAPLQRAMAIRLGSTLAESLQESGHEAAEEEGVDPVGSSLAQGHDRKIKKD